MNKERAAQLAEKDAIRMKEEVGNNWKENELVNILLSLIRSELYA